VPTTGAQESQRSLADSFPDSPPADRRLAVVDVALHSDGRDELVAKAQVTYSIPP
jgi:acyl-coenzyme A thioesterase PaaI-like protein